MARNVHPVPGSIKSIQRGVISIANATSSATATITSVNTSKAVLSFLGAEATADDVRQLPFLTFTNATTITATRSSTTGNQQVSFQVVEYH